ncbi:hypothetical protein OW763_13975 [Clostridium aestuarii]|uniref:Uncharacterized protein n=1 Tax=Clostridium aestuarii TaxID=338193 RepID=A0ABT4D5X9_9CLOT|nr:hypothetical protein [Clostridium aestuarii]MCY6485438.1 hypothetical protein [Clostridium aestuarii]
MKKLNNNKQEQQKLWKFIGGFSVCIAILSIGIVVFQILFILKFGGMPLVLTPYISPVGIILGIASFLIYSNRLAKLGIISNIILFFLPWIYFYLGTLILGP